MQSSDLTTFLLAALPVIRRVAIHVLGADDAMLDDAMQEALIKVWRNHHRYTDGNFAGWVGQITANCCRDMIRYNNRKRRRLVLLGDIDEVPLADDPLAAILCDEQRQMVRQAVDSLLPQHRYAIDAVHLQEMDYSAAANVLGVPLGTLKAQVHRGKAVLRQNFSI